jgi:hypothetical protein
MEKASEPTIKMKYEDIGNFEFAQSIQKIGSANTSSYNASRICKLMKQLQKARNEIHESFTKDMLERYAQRNEDGTIKRPEGDPNGFTPLDDKVEEYTKEQEAFGKRLYEFTCAPLNPSILQDVKLSARDIETLKDLFIEESGPGLPPGHSFGGPQGIAR